MQDDPDFGESEMSFGTDDYLSWKLCHKGQAHQCLKAN